MLLRIYSVRDTVSLSYNIPFFAKTDGEATRLFKDLVNDPQSTPGKHPEDFQLWLLGMFDPSTGEIIPTEADKVVNAVLLLDQVPKLMETQAE